MYECADICVGVAVCVCMCVCMCMLACAHIHSDGSDRIHTVPATGFITERRTESSVRDLHRPHVHDRDGQSRARHIVHAATTAV